jgi:hypothetical protein
MGTEVMLWSRYVPGWLSVCALKVSTHPKLPEPFLSLICLLLAESHINQRSIIRLDSLESESMFVKIVKVLLGVGRRACTQTLEISLGSTYSKND